MNNEYRLYIGGQWLSPEGGKHFECKSPYDGSIWANCPYASAAQVDSAVEAARAAFEGSEWTSALPARRAELLRTLGQIIEQNVDRLADVQVQENGKLVREIHGQTVALAKYCYYYAGLAETLQGETIPLSVPSMLNYTVREPLGVVAMITPWNSPLSLLMWKLAPALAAGNTVVVKPSEVTPISTLLLAELIEKAGFPAGVFNVVTGHGDVGEALVMHPGVNKIAFTGSTGVGKSIAEKAGSRLIRTTLELGGKSANIVFADADPEEAVNGIMAGIFAAAGQTCLAGSRALIHASIYDKIVEILVDKTSKVMLGDPRDMATEMGPVACQKQFDKVMNYICIAQEEGATLLTGGKKPAFAGPEALFVEPTIFGDVRNSMRIAQEEVFGPVLCLIKYETDEEAISIANDSPFGLAAGIWTRDIKRAHASAARLRSGTVWINTYRRTNFASPFGGYKESGIGRENGVEAMKEYTEVKSVWVNYGAPIKDPFNPRA
ncbi:aldehyde dehydrogenase [Allopusillimonas ginsengisoli]|nr:aldehyde dehydrogenase [Allopusillimonas ginsengisoli]